MNDPIRIVDLPASAGVTGNEMFHASDPVAGTDTKMSAAQLANAILAQITVTDPAILAAIRDNTASEVAALAAVKAILTGTLTVLLPASSLPLPTVNLAAAACKANVLCAVPLGGSLVANTLAPVGIVAVANPAGSGKVVFLDSLTLSAPVDFSLTRWRSTTAVAGSPLAPVSTSGLLAAAPAARIYPTPAIPTSTLEMVQRSASGCLTLAWGGSLAIQPGQTFVFSAVPFAISTAAQAVAGELRWWEGPTSP